MSKLQERSFKRLVRIFPKKHLLLIGIIISVLFSSITVFFGYLINSFKNGWTLLFIKALYEIIFKININRSVIKGNHLIKYLRLKKEPYNNIDCNFTDRIKSKMIDILLKIYDK